MAFDQTPGRGARFRFAPDTRTVSQALERATISNGLILTTTPPPPGTSTHRVNRSGILDGEVINRSPFVTADTESGIPDGMCSDSDGSLWVALYCESALRR